MPRLHKIDFSEAEAQYWFLFWISLIKYNNRQKKSYSIFTIKKQILNYFNNDPFLNTCNSVDVPVSYLSEYRSGSLYNSKKIR